VTWVMSNLGLNRLETVLVSAQDSCMVSAKHTMAQKLFWTHQMVLLCNEAQVEAHFGPFGDSGNLDTSLVHGLRETYHMLENNFGRTRWNSKVTRVMSNHVSVRLKMVLVLVQDRCTVCTKRTIGS